MAASNTPIKGWAPPSASTPVIDPNAPTAFPQAPSPAPVSPNKNRDMSRFVATPQPPPGMVKPGNIDLKKRPVVHNKDGSYSTVRSITIQTDKGYVLIPTVVGKKVVSNKAAISHYKKTGQHLGIFTSEQAADQYATNLHDQQAQAYGAAAGDKPPVPALQQYGLSMNIDELNDNVQKMTDAFAKSHGYTPSPGLVFDVLKSQGITGPINYDQLFGTPTSQKQALVDIAARKFATSATGGDFIATLPVIEPSAQQIVTGMKQAIAQDEKRMKLAPGQSPFMGSGHDISVPNAAGNLLTDQGDSAFHIFMTSNRDAINQALQDPKQSNQIVRALIQYLPTGKEWYTNNPLSIGYAPGQQKKYQAIEAKRILTEGVSTPNLNFISRFAGQIANATINMPYGFYKLVRGIGLDGFDLSTMPLSALGAPVRDRSSNATHTLNLLRQMGNQIIHEDVAHPLRNPGYLAMDIWGVATVGAGTASKLGRAGSAIADAGSVGEAVGGATKALVSKAPPEWTDMGIDGRNGTYGYHEAMPLSDTAIVRVLQKNTPILGRTDRQRVLQAQHSLDGFEEDVTNRIPDIISTEKMLAKARQANLQIEYAVALTPVVEMTRLARADQWARDVFKETALKGHLGDWKNVALKHRLGAQKAIQVIMTDDPDPLNMWRSFHERQINDLQGDLKNFSYKAGRKIVESSGGEVKIPEAMKQVEKTREFRSAVGEMKYSIAAHQSQLEALDLAQKIITNPTDRFKGLVDAAYETSAAQERMKEYVSGFDKEKMGQHVAQIAGFARGENIIDLGDGLRGVTSADPDYVKALLEDEERTQNKLKGAQQRLNQSRRTGRIQTGMEQEVARNERAVLRHEIRMKGITKRIEKLRAEATPLKRVITADNPPVVDENVAALREGKGSAYSGPTQPERYRGERRIRNFLRPNSRFGYRPPELAIKTWTGKSIEMGDFRWDTSELLGEQMKMAFRASQHYSTHQSLWSIAKTVPEGDFDQPIRDIKTIPDELRNFVTGMERAQIDKRFAEIASDATMDDLRKFLYPTPQEVRDGVVPKTHVRYVDERLMLDRVGKVPTQFWQILDQGLNSTMGIINEPARLLLIFATPAYALNALGSAALLLVHQGFLAPVNLARAMMAEHVYGPAATRLIDRLAGQTHAASLATEKAWYTKGSDVLMNTWARITDTYFRRAAVIHELRRNGLLKDDWKSHDDHLADLQHPDNATKVSMGSQTARKAMLDFQDMSWPERATLRHIFFVYAFIRASSIWSLRFLRDHGAMSAALAQAGRDRQQNLDEMVGHMPDWFMRSGYFAVHPGTIYNPVQWNMPGMLAQTVYPLTSIFGHTPYANAGDLLGPAAQVVESTVTGLNSSGQALPRSSTLAKVPLLGGSFGDSILSQWQTTPLGQIGVKNAKAAKQAGSPLKPEQVKSSFENPIGAALAHERSGINQSVFDNDGFWNTWGLALFRSGITRDVNATAGEARYWRDLRETDPKAYHQHEIAAVNRMLQRQSKVVREPVPGDVERAVDTIANVSQAIEDYKLKHKGEPSPNDMQINQITLDTLAAEGHIRDKARWQTRILNDKTQADMSSTRVQMLYAAGGKAWKTWMDKVNRIDSYAQPKYASGVGNMINLGLGDYTASTTAPREQRWAYGRKAVTVLDKAKELAGQYAAQTGDQAAQTRQAWIQYVNDNDKPVTIGGVEYPSPFQLDFASKSETAQQQAVASYSKRSPAELTAFQTQLLTGDRPKPVVSEAWQTISKWMQAAQTSTPLGKSVPSGQRKFYEDYLASKSPEFNAALKFARLPLAERMKTYEPIKNSTYSKAWDWTLSTVSERLDELNKMLPNSQGKPNVNAVHRYWIDHDVPILIDQIKSRYGQGFTSELALYTGATSQKNADAYLDKFLGRLISP